MVEESLEFLDFLRIPKTDKEIIEEFYTSTNHLLPEFIIKKCIEKKDNKWVLTDKGKDKLKQLRETENRKQSSPHKLTTIKLKGNNNNIVGNSENSSITQEILSQIPMKDRKWYQKLLSSLISSIGINFTLSLLGGLTLGTFTFNYFNKFNPVLFGEITMNNIIFVCGCFFLWLTYYAFKNSKENRCGNCGRYFSYIETGDADVLAESPNGKKAKIERTLKCSKCGDEKLEVKWEDLE